MCLDGGTQPTATSRSRSSLIPWKGSQLLVCLFVFNTVVFTAGRQSPQRQQRSSAPPSRCKSPDRADYPSALRGTAAMARLPVFPLNSGSPPSSPKGERAGGEEEKRRPNQPGPFHQPLPGSRSGTTTGGRGEQKGQGGRKALLGESQVRLLVGLHYLPHEHGPAAHKLLQDLTWLRSNCHLVSTHSKKSPPQKVPMRFLSNSKFKKKTFLPWTSCCILFFLPPQMS